MPYSPTSFSAVEENALRLDGLSWRHGTLLWPQSSPPLREERASLVAAAIPRWAHAAGQTAAWVWTGLGSAEPFDVMAPLAPAVSPIARATWKPRFVDTDTLQLRRISGLSLVSRSDLLTDLLTCLGDDQSVAAQLWALMPDLPTAPPETHPWHHSHGRCLNRMQRRLTLLSRWRELNPS